MIFAHKRANFFYYLILRLRTTIGLDIATAYYLAACALVYQIAACYNVCACSRPNIASHRRGSCNIAMMAV
jgi:hypothetical protein